MPKHARIFTERQERFIAEYVVDYNATQAVIRAGYSRTGADVTGVRLLGNPRIAAAISKHKLALAERTAVAVTDVIRESKRIAFADIRDVVTWDDDGVYLRPSSELTSAEAAAIREMKVTRTVIRDKAGSETEREVREVKMHSKDSSLDRLARLFPEFSEKHEVKSVNLDIVVQMGKDIDG